jgi:hypothetical protein
MVERFTSLAGSLNRDLEVFLNVGLADVLDQPFGS